MKVGSDSTTEDWVRAPKSQMPVERLTNGLLVAAAVVYGVGAVLLVAAPMPPTLAWGPIAAVSGLLVLAFLVGAARGVGPIIAGLWHRRYARDAWANLWEELMRRPVR